MIEGKHGSGTYVAVQIQRSLPQKTTRKASKRANNLGTKQWLSIAQPFTPGIPALDAFPKNIWAKLSSRWARALTISELNYGDPVGIMPLRAAIAHYIGSTRGVVCNYEQVIITSGSQGALATASMLVGDYGDSVYIEEPGYVSARNTLKLCGLKLIPTPLDKAGIRTSDMEQHKAKIALVSPSHQYPLGITMPMKRRMELINWAHKVNGWIIEDDYDGEYRYDSAPLPALASLDPKGSHVLYIGTLSKVLSPSIRLGFIIVPENLINQARNIRSAFDRGVSTFIQAVLTDFISEGHMSLHIRKTQSLYAERRLSLLTALKELDLKPIGSPAGLHFTVPLDIRLDREISQVLANKGLGGNPLSQYYNTKQHIKNGLVLGFSNALAHNIKKLEINLKNIIK